MTLIPCSAKNGSTRLLSKSAAAIGVLVVYRLAAAHFEILLVNTSHTLDGADNSDRKYRRKNPSPYRREIHCHKLGCQIKQTNLVFDNVLLKTTHGVAPLRLRAWLIKIHTFIKPGNPTLWQDFIVRSSLNSYSQIPSS